jgi:hypothetical protein
VSCCQHANCCQGGSHSHRSLYFAQQGNNVLENCLGRLFNARPNALNHLRIHNYHLRLCGVVKLREVSNLQVAQGFIDIVNIAEIGKRLAEITFMES